MGGRLGHFHISKILFFWGVLDRYLDLLEGLFARLFFGVVGGDDEVVVDDDDDDDGDDDDDDDDVAANDAA